MKNIIIFINIFMVLVGCNSQKIDTMSINKIYNSEEFLFEARQAIPSNQDVRNVVNSIPNFSATELFMLDKGFSINVKNQIMTINLPYFGRSYSSTITSNNNDTSLRFVSKKYSVSKSLNKGEYKFTIKPQDVPAINYMELEIFDNGKAYLFVDLKDRQAISYEGEIGIN